MKLFAVGVMSLFVVGCGGGGGDETTDRNFSGIYQFIVPSHTISCSLGVDTTAATSLETYTVTQDGSSITIFREDGGSYSGSAQNDGSFTVSGVDNSSTVNLSTSITGRFLSSGWEGQRQQSATSRTTTLQCDSDTTFTGDLVG